MELESSYDDAVRRGVVRELPTVAEAVAPQPQPPDTRYQQILARIDGRWEDNDPPGSPA